MAPISRSVAQGSTAQQDTAAPIPPAPPAGVPAGPVETQPPADMLGPHYVPGQFPNAAAENGPVIEAVEHVIAPTQDTSPLHRSLYGLPFEN
ncbi:hypothetical protein FRC11_006900 [Ceratobasidium sp. 423]|nr:hypothetical protein FRC11_006900 [Ceratobasidium sp. 423]